LRARGRDGGLFRKDRWFRPLSLLLVLPVTRERVWVQVMMVKAKAKAKGRKKETPAARASGEMLSVCFNFVIFAFIDFLSLPLFFVFTFLGHLFCGKQPIGTS